MSEELDEMLGMLESNWAIARRRRWWILFPVLLAWLTVWGIGWVWPPTFQSEAVILLNQQSVPNQYVTPNVSAGPQDRLQIISQQVLSRTRLQTIIDRFHLYPEPHGLALLLIPGDPIDHMRKDIEIERVPDPGHPDEVTAFKLRYSARSPKLAQEVNQELASPFVTENVEAQKQLSEETTAFLENELAEARRKMEEQEARVAAFKAKHLGELPGQLDMNTQQILTGIQAQLQNSHEALDSAMQHKRYLEALLHDVQSAHAISGTGGTYNGATGGPTDTVASTAKALDKELIELRNRLQGLQERYTDDYPEVVSLKNSIEKKEKLKKQTEDLADAIASGRKTPKMPGQGAMEELQDGSSAPLMQLESQIKANEQEIKSYRKHEGDLELQVSNYLARLKSAPQTEQELAEIARGYEESKTNYNLLLQKQMQSQLATSLELRQRGEQFRILDPPSLPNKRMAPNRFKFSLGGLALGMVLGVGLAVLLELNDIRVRNEKDLKAIVPVPLLITIPRLSTLKEEETQAMARWLDFGAVTIMLVLIAGGNVYAFFKR